MDIRAYLQGFEWTPINLAKVAAAALAGLLLIALAVSIVGTILSPLTQSGVSLLPQKGGAYYGTDDMDYAVAEESYDSGYAGNAPALSARNVAAIYPPQPYPDGSVGGEAEAYEVTEYGVTIESGSSERTCGNIFELKSKDYVVFERSDEHDRGCSFTFKVEKEHVDEIVAFLEEQDPEEFSESVRTILRQVQDFTSEEDILRKKLETVTTTLESATEAYEGITDLAIRTQNADSLARVIESKLQIIERLTQERIAVSAQLERLSRAKAEQLDRLEYTYFNVSVYENKIIDGEALSDSWTRAAAATVHQINTVLTEITLGLVALAFLIGQWVLYALILVVIAKYLWRFIRAFWQM